MERHPSGVVYVREDGTIDPEPVVAWSSPDIDDDAAALIHRAFSDGRSVRNPQTRTCLTSGQNISYGTRLPQGGGGDLAESLCQSDHTIVALCVAMLGMAAVLLLFLSSCL